MYLLNLEPSFRDEKRITARQSEILQLLAEGMSMKEVANVLDVKPSTVTFHKYQMMQTLNVKTNAELYRICNQAPHNGDLTASNVRMDDLQAIRRSSLWRRPTLHFLLCVHKIRSISPRQQSRSRRRLGTGDRGDHEHNSAVATVRFWQTRDNRSLTLKKMVMPQSRSLLGTWIRNGC